MHFQIHARTNDTDWEVEPECGELTRAEAHQIIKTLEKTNEEGYPMQYQIVVVAS